MGPPTTSRPGEIRRWDKLVDALTGASADAGSIPAASMFVQEGEPWVPPLSISPSTCAHGLPLPALSAADGCVSLDPPLRHLGLGRCARRTSVSDTEELVSLVEP